jgi:hypothetical protein
LFSNETEDTKVPDAVLAKYNQDEPIIVVGMSEAWKNCLMMRVASSVAQMAKPTNWLSLALAKLYEEGRGAVSGFPWGLSPLRGAMPQWHRTNNSPLCEFEAHLYFWPSERKYIPPKNSLWQFKFGRNTFQQSGIFVGNPRNPLLNENNKVKILLNSTFPLLVERLERTLPCVVDNEEIRRANKT